MQTYQDRIAVTVPDANARHVEAMMRCEYETLDGLSAVQFADLARACAIDARDMPAVAERLARSFGL